MDLNFNLTGADRKRLVTSISEITNTAIKYLGAPSFAYEVGVITVDKNGTATGIDESLKGRLVEKGFVAEETEEISLTIEVPKADFTDAALENLQRLITSKAALIKKAIGTDNLDIDIAKDRICFPWFSPQGDAALVRAYTLFVTALCDMAKTQCRINSTEKPVDNEKYSFRCFLLRLGFIGNGYKAERKILLRNLTGSSAFKEVTKNEND